MALLVAVRCSLYSFGPSSSESIQALIDCTQLTTVIIYIVSFKEKLCFQYIQRNQGFKFQLTEVIGCRIARETYIIYLQYEQSSYSIYKSRRNPKVPGNLDIGVVHMTVESSI